MLAELYHLAFQYIAINGPWLALLVFSFLSSFPVYVPVLALSYYYRRKGKTFKLGTQIVWLIMIALAVWFLILLVEEQPLSYLIAIWKLTLILILGYIPIWLVYTGILRKWPKLPWMAVQFVIVWLVFFAIWYYLIFIFRLFGTGVLMSI